MKLTLHWFQCCLTIYPLRVLITWIMNYASFWNWEIAQRLHGKTESSNEINELPLIFREQGSAKINAMEQYILKQGIEVNRKYELVSNEAVKQAENAGLGYSIMPLIGLRNSINAGEIKVINVKGLPIQTQWTLCYLKGKKLSPAAKAFISYLGAHKDQIIEKHFSWT